MNRFIVICAILLTTPPVAAFAQAGSTGGTIGKQDKSASGGEVRVPTRERRAHVARKHHVAPRGHGAPSAKRARFTVAKIKHKVYAKRWVHCATEGGFCRAPFGAFIHYGQGNTFTHRRSPPGGLPCNNGVFGDPLPFVHKECFFSRDRW